MATYRGIAFPFGRSSAGIPKAIEDEELIKQSLIQIIGVVPGERIMRSDFGCNALSFVFEDNNELLAEMIRDSILTSITKYETRVIVQGVDVVRAESEVIVTIKYTVSLTQQQDSVVVNIPTNS